MIINSKSPQLILSVLLLVGLFGCASPRTKTIAISPEELRLEQQAQIAMAQSFSPKRVARKHNNLSVYECRLLRVAAPLQRAAKKIDQKHTGDYKFRVVNDGGLTAWTDGKYVSLTPEMMDFLETDKELATVVAHELAHNVMQHHAKQRHNVVFGTLVDIAVAASGTDTRGLFGSLGNLSYAQAFENEADYVGIYIMANAGYDISDVQNIWRKMTMQTQTGTHRSFFNSHPSNPERFIRMQRTIAEVQAKKKAGIPLVPNYNA